MAADAVPLAQLRTGATCTILTHCGDRGTPDPEETFVQQLTVYGRPFACWVPGDDDARSDPFVVTSYGGASPTDPSTWCTYATCMERVRKGNAVGVGIMLNGDGIVGVDFDDCRNRPDGRDHPAGSGMDRPGSTATPNAAHPAAVCISLFAVGRSCLISFAKISAAMPGATNGETAAEDRAVERPGTS